MNQDPILILLYPEDFDEHLIQWAQAQIDADPQLAQELQALQQTHQLLTQSQLFQSSKTVSLKAEQKTLILQAAKQKATEFKRDQKATSSKAWSSPIFIFSLSILAMTAVSQLWIHNPQHQDHSEMASASKPQSNAQSTQNDLINQSEKQLIESMEGQRLALAQEELRRNEYSKQIHENEAMAKNKKSTSVLKNKDLQKRVFDFSEEADIEDKKAEDKALTQAIAQNERERPGSSKTKALEKPSKKSKAGLESKQKAEQAKAESREATQASLGKGGLPQADLDQKKLGRSSVQYSPAKEAPIQVSSAQPNQIQTDSNRGSSTTSVQANAVQAGSSTDSSAGSSADSSADSSAGSAQTDLMQASLDSSSKPTKALGPEPALAQNQMPPPSSEPVSPKPTTKATKTASRQSVSASSPSPMIAAAEPKPMEEAEAGNEDAQMIAQGMSQSQSVPRVTPMNIDQKPTPTEDAGLDTLDEARKLLRNGKPNQALEQYMLWINQAPTSPKKRQAIQEAKALAQQLNRNDLLKKLKSLEEEELSPPKEADEAPKKKMMKFDGINGF